MKGIALKRLIKWSLAAAVFAHAWRIQINRVRILRENSLIKVPNSQMQTSRRGLQPSYITSSFTMLIVSWGSAAVIIFRAT